MIARDEVEELDDKDEIIEEQKMTETILQRLQFTLLSLVKSGSGASKNKKKGDTRVSDDDGLVKELHGSTLNRPGQLLDQHGAALSDLPAVHGAQLGLHRLRHQPRPAPRPRHPHRAPLLRRGGRQDQGRHRLLHGQPGRDRNSPYALNIWLPELKEAKEQTRYCSAPWGPTTWASSSPPPSASRCAPGPWRAASCWPGLSGRWGGPPTTSSPPAARRATASSSGWRWRCRARTTTVGNT